MDQVLVIDDEPEYLDELVEALGFLGHATISVGRGAEAIDTLRRDPAIRVILTDMRMPDMDGITLIKAVQETFPGRKIDFLMMTGHAAPGDIAQALAAGVVRCFRKPLAFEDLCAALVELDGGKDEGA
ncbi:response regulator [Xanthobacter versatilis]|uniref:Response regulator receiver protein n=1 Tax=Xanthobacter autotrophicus (strain ATCC BAA-1158 / Py2) TaxID=78245 RepID=A7IEC1_XANP2|nr:response regulator receiver protein [Xanthobacter autotrophicus Py2]